MFKRKAQEINLRKRKEIEFYTDRFLGKGENRENMWVGWVGIDQIKNSIVSIRNLKLLT